MRIMDMITKDEFAWFFYQLLSFTSVGNEYRQQLRILILGFKGLRTSGRIMTGTWRDMYLLIIVVTLQ